MGSRNTRSSAAASKVKTPAASKAKTPAAKKSAGTGVAAKSSTSKADSQAGAVPAMSYAARLKVTKEGLRPAFSHMTEKELDALARSTMAQGSKAVSGEKECQEGTSPTLLCHGTQRYREMQMSKPRARP